MLTEFLDRILQLTKPEVVTVDGEDYASRALSLPPAEHLADPIDVHSLVSIVDYCTENVDDRELESYLLVVEAKQVDLLSPLLGRRAEREHLLGATPNPTQHNWGQFIPLDEFNVWLRTGFVETADQQKLLELTSNVVLGDDCEIKDDGVSQSVVIKSSIASRAAVDIPKIVALRPYQTFIEVDQPEVPMVVRLRKEDGAPWVAMFHADGGAWRNEAAASILTFLVNEFTERSGELLRPVLMT